MLSNSHLVCRLPALTAEHDTPRDGPASSTYCFTPFSNTYARKRAGTGGGANNTQSTTVNGGGRTQKGRTGWREIDIDNDTNPHHAIGH